MRLSEHSLRESRLLSLVLLYVAPLWVAALALFGGYHTWLSSADELTLETWLFGTLLAFGGPGLWVLLYTNYLPYPSNRNPQKDLHGSSSRSWLVQEQEKASEYTFLLSFSCLIGLPSHTIHPWHSRTPGASTDTTKGKGVFSFNQQAYRQNRC